MKFESPRPRWQATISPIALCIMAVWCGACIARADNPNRSRFVLIVCDCLTFNDLDLASGDHPQLTYIAHHGSIGLMNCAVADPKSDTAAMLTIAAGRQVPAEKTDEQAANDWEKAPGERISAAVSHRIRAATPDMPPYVFDPAHSVKHLGIASLKLRGLDTGRLGDALANATPPVSSWIVGNADTAGWRRRAALLTVNRLGVGSGMVALRSYDPAMPYGLTDSPQDLAEYALQSNASFVVIEMGDGARAEAARGRLSMADYRIARRRAADALDRLIGLLRTRLSGRRADLLIVAPRPPAADAAHPAAWARLTPILGYGPDFPAGIFESATTRTPGLIANIDVAPTILAHFGIAAPPTMIGRPMRVIAQESDAEHAAKRLAAVARMDFIAWANAVALVPLLAILGTFCFLACAGGLLALRSRSRAASHAFALCLVFAMNFPAAQLFAPILVRPEMLEYGLRLAAWMLALTLVTYGAARAFRVSLPTAACALNISMVLADVVTGQHLLKDALISNYYLPGFRYYGIGNDYLGLLLAYAIGGTFSLLDDRSVLDSTSHTKGIVLAWIVFAVILGWPAWGANSGSLIVSCCAFGAGWSVIRGRGNSWLYALSFMLVGIAISFAFAQIDAQLHGAESAHAGAAIRAAESGRGTAYLWSIVVRKVQFNLSLFAVPWTWFTASLVGGVVLLASLLAGLEIEEARRRRPWLARSGTVFAAASVAALIFKDSGIATACNLAAGGVLIGFFYLLVPAVPAGQSSRTSSLSVIPAEIFSRDS